MKKLMITLSVGIFLLLLGHGVMVFAEEEAMDMKENPTMVADDTATPSPKQAVAVITGTQPDSTIKGIVTFTETEDGLQVTAEVYGVPVAGKHGFHIHEKGSCEDAGNAAGGHYNPHGVSHGFLPKDGMEAAHFGDMGNIEIDSEGSGTLSLDLAGLTLTGENNVLGHAVILHEKEDDFGQPTGNAGSRIGCGIITVAE